MPRFIFTKQLSHLKSKFFVRKKISIKEMSRRKANTIIGVLLVVFGLMYIWQINSMATIGYAMNELESQKSDLEKTNQQLRIKVTEAKSSKRILKRLEALEMDAVHSVSYISPRSDVVVAK